MLKSFANLFRIMQFYAVARGRQTGIFHSWSDCEQQIKGYSGAIYKKFKTQNEAEQFIEQKRQISITSAALSVGVKTKKRPVPNQTESAQPTKKAKIDELKTTSYTSNIVKTKRYGEYEFLEDDQGFVHVYTDGSCENNGRANAIAGFGVYFSEDHPLNTAEPVVGLATNNRGEIQAATKAITLAANNNIKRLCINADSQFVIKSVTEWMASWKRRNWKLAGGGAVKNEQDFKQLDSAMRNNPQLEIQWKYVPAHVGILGNERADQLAREGAKTYKKKL